MSVSEDLGSFADVFDERGLRFTYLDAGIDDLARLDAITPALLVILGWSDRRQRRSRLPLST